MTWSPPQPFFSAARQATSSMSISMESSVWRWLCSSCIPAWTLPGETISPLLGKQADPELIDRITQLVLSHEKILGIHDLLVHDYVRDSALPPSTRN